MSSKNYTNDQLDTTYNGKSRIGIVVSSWNDTITRNLSTACQAILSSHGVLEDHIKVIHVPGSFELALGARWLLGDFKADAVICLGCIIKGETDHDKYISQSLANGLINLSLTSNKPVIFGVLTTDSKEQALERSGGQYGNKGEEAALTALKMLEVRQSLKPEKSTIGFGTI